MELVGKATDAGVPINFHQLSDNKFMKIIGETAENVPLAGGGSLRAKRRGPSTTLAAQMDPETDITVLDDASFKRCRIAQAGGASAKFPANTKVPAADFGDLMTDRSRAVRPTRRPWWSRHGLKT